MPGGLRLILLSLLTLEVVETLLLRTPILSELLRGIKVGERDDSWTFRERLFHATRPLSLGVRLRGAAGLPSRRRRFGIGDMERDLERPREERWE
jgi:hypothetical protein